MRALLLRCSLLTLLSLSCTAAVASDHDELDATLQAPYRGDALTGARTFRIVLERPSPPPGYSVPWRFTLVGPDGQPVQTWRGVQALAGAPVTIDIAWDGTVGGKRAAAGNYVASLEADDITQRWQIRVGSISAPLALTETPRAAATIGTHSQAASPWRIVLGNLHSQTGHSDGGGDLASCNGAQAPQSSPLGPREAYAYAQQHGLDFLLTSEHNHLYDGSTGTNAQADPASARGLFGAGLAAAAAYNATHPDFLAVYGVEWGVIDHGGHLNIFNAPGLPGWERNGSGALLADIETPKNDYAALYTTMRTRGWIGQFNHPASSGQFMVGDKPLGYTADGDAAMVLCEVVNTNAFSNTALEDESRRSNYESACNKALEAGFHVAFSSDQDNHCANWGMSYTNRTGVLLPAAAAPTQQAFFDALRARRVFATMDKTSSLILTANGHLMGERFTNSGNVTLDVQFSSSSGKRLAQVSIFEGVPGRNGTVSQLSDIANTSFLPSPGGHFYYATAIEEDGNMLWTAPIWVQQDD